MNAPLSALRWFERKRKNHRHVRRAAQKETNRGIDKGGFVGFEPRNCKTFDRMIRDGTEGSEKEGETRDMQTGRMREVRRRVRSEAKAKG
jgi:hypothetical protein